MADTSLTTVARSMPKPTKDLAEQLYDAILNGTTLPSVGDPELMNRMILEETIAAAHSGNIERVFQAQTLESWNQFAGDEPVIVYSFHTNASKFEGGPSCYAVCEIGYPDSDGVEQRAQVTVGGQKVMVQLVALWENYLLPAKVRLTEKATGTEGRKVLGLVLEP